MRALQLVSYSGPDGLRPAKVPEPPRDDKVLIEVRAIGINYPDLLFTRGLYQHHPDLPCIPGCEIAGVVADAPANSRWAPGDRVAAFVWDGGYAERAAAPTNAVVSIPAEADLSVAAGMVVNYHTTYFALARRGRLAPGETLLVLGAAGGTGSAAVQVGRGLGARVIGGVALAQDAPDAHEVVVLAEGFAARIRELTDGRGADVVFDPLGDWLFDEGLRALAPEGRVLVVGFAAGEIPRLGTNRLLHRNASVVGVGWGAFLDRDPSLMHDAGQALDEMFRAGIVSPRITERYSFEDIPAALERLGQGEIAGKAVVAIASDGEADR